MTPVMPAPHLELGAATGQFKGKVAIKLGALVSFVTPATARAYAIALIHTAEIAGLPEQPKQEPKPPLALVPAVREVGTGAAESASNVSNQEAQTQ